MLGLIYPIDLEESAVIHSLAPSYNRVRIWGMIGWTQKRLDVISAMRDLTSAWGRCSPRWRRDRGNLCPRRFRTGRIPRRHTGCRFFANGNVSEDRILEGHFSASSQRFQATTGPILILQDTTEFSFTRTAPEKIGFTKTSTGRKEKDGRFRQHTLCGLLMHASLAVTPEGLPLGLAAAKFWSRRKFKGTAALKRKVNPMRVPIEQKESMRWLDNLRRSYDQTGAPERCIHVGDRESDIYERYCLAE